MGGTTPFTIISGGYWHYQKVSSLRESKKDPPTNTTSRWQEGGLFYELLLVQLLILILFVYSLEKKSKIKLIILREYKIQGPPIVFFQRMESRVQESTK